MREAMTFVLRASADPMVSSPLMSSGYERQMPDYQSYLDRPMPSP